MRLRNVRNAKEIVDNSDYVVHNPFEYKGKCKNIEELPSANYLVVVLENGKEKLVPFIYKEFIKEVLEDRIIVNEIEGLF